MNTILCVKFLPWFTFALLKEAWPNDLFSTIKHPVDSVAGYRMSYPTWPVSTAHASVFL